MARILICEDEPDTRESLKSILEKKGSEVHTASDGQEAIAKTRQLKPDLLLLDIRMPKVDGLEAAKEIRKFDARTKIVFITGFQSPEISKEAAKYNIAGYLVKPVSTEAILRIINEGPVT